MTWRTVDECFMQIRNGANIKQGMHDGGLPITRIETIANDCFNRDRMGYAGITDAGKYESYILRDGDLLVSHINSLQYLGRTVEYKKSGEEIIIHGMNLLGLRPNRDIINPTFAQYAFRSIVFREQLSRITKKSVNQASFTISDLKKINLNVPDLSAQQVIVDSLEKTKRVIKQREQQIQSFETLVKARFVEMFGDPVSNPKGWRVIPWEGVFDTKTGKLDSNAAVEGGEYPFFTCAKEWLWIDKYAYDCEALLLAGNNAAGVYDVKHYKGKFNAYQRTYILQLKDVDWSYSLFKYQLEDRLQYLQSQSKGTNTRYLTMGILNSLTFIVPPKELQDEFTTLVSQVDKSKVAIQKALDETQLLYESLMQKYFG